MTKKIFILFCVSLFTIAAYAQAENTRDSISINTIGIENSYNKPLQEPADPQQPETQKEYISAEEQKKRIEFLNTLTFPVPPTYEGPIDPALKNFRPRYLPYNEDYAFYASYDLGNNVSLKTISQQNRHLTIGSLGMINAALYYQPLSWLSISGGTYAAKYDIYGRHFKDMGVTGSLRFKLHDRVYLRAHGRYSINSNDKHRDFPQAAQGMFPQSYYGGGIEVKITDKFGVEGGIVRELNPMSGKWQNRSYVMPIFYPLGR